MLIEVKKALDSAASNVMMYTVDEEGTKSVYKVDQSIEIWSAWAEKKGRSMEDLKAMRC